MEFYPVKVCPSSTYCRTDRSTGETAKSIFERAQLPNETLGRIWALADTEQKGALGLTEFIIAMHLLASMKNGSMRAVPQVLPPGLHEAATRRGAPRQIAGSRPTSDSAPSTIPRQFSGAAYQDPSRSGVGFQQPIPTSDQWLISPQDKSQFDSIFATVDTQDRGFITGDQAVGFFSNSRLPEEALAQIWDLADINSEGQLNRDEFAVAMYLIRQQRSKTVGREVLPQQLPPNLVPPNMRRKPIAPQQPTAPTFDNAVNITAPKSASEDLFGLDATSTPTTSAPLQAKGTGDSSAYTTPPRNQASPPPSAPSISHFKPFVPSSSFGQTIMTPQGTGTTGSASPALSRGFPPQSKQANVMEDLLGDNDPEVSKRLTTETSDLANLSNQVSMLTNQMQDTKSKRGITEQELSQAQNQKAQFETRLAELRTAYEQEVREVRALDERLQISRNETKKLQSDMAMIQGTYEDLKAQHHQISEALASDQNENGSLKEKIRLTSTEIEQLKPQLEKLRSEARHQKGLVAINKKQLATHEVEREKAKADIQSASEEHAEATRDLQQSQRDLESASQPRAAAIASPEVPLAHTPAPVPALPIASPAPSTGSMNPFFRRPSNPPATSGGVASSPFTLQNAATPNQNAFDSFFGPSATTSSASPTALFGSNAPNVSRELPPPQEIVQQPLVAAGTITPSVSPPPSSLGDSPVISSKPPAPPESRQITSSFLPLKPQLEQSGSESSSVKVLPPTSRAGERSETPSYAQSEATIPDSPKQHFQELAAQAPQAKQPQLTPSSSEQTPEITGQEATAPVNIVDTTDLPSAKRDVPGAFPGDETPIERSEQSIFASTASPFNNLGIDSRVDSAPQPQTSSVIPAGNSLTGEDTFIKSSTPVSSKDDFDSAFEGFPINKGKAPETRNGNVTDDPFGQQSKAEFPPIKELGADDDSDSDSEKGFDDDFTTRSGKKIQDSNIDQSLPKQALSQESGLPPPQRPPFTTTDSNKSQLPTPGAQVSPPTYDQTIGSSYDRKGSNPFPAEYTGLLPSRDDPTSPPSLSPQMTRAHNPELTASAGINRSLNFSPGEKNPEQVTDHTITSPELTKIQSPMSPGASTAAPYAFSHTSSPPQQPQAATQAPIPPAKIPPKDDFDDFEDLTPAQEEDAKEGDDTIDFSRQPTTDLDFNPIFDSPSISSHAPGPSQSSTTTFPAPPTTTSDSFANFTSSTTPTATAPGSVQKQQTPAPAVHDWDAIFVGLDTAQEQRSNVGSGIGSGGEGVNGVASPPLAGGAAAVETDDDDPILKRLIGMGFARGDSLRALEKFDYNIDKVR